MISVSKIRQHLENDQVLKNDKFKVLRLNKPNNSMYTRYINLLNYTILREGVFKDNVRHTREILNYISNYIENNDIIINERDLYYFNNKYYIYHNEGFEIALFYNE